MNSNNKISNARHQGLGPQNVAPHPNPHEILNAMVRRVFAQGGPDIRLGSALNHLI